jgi:hypothetical protein
MNLHCRPLSVVPFSGGVPELMVGWLRFHKPLD